METNDQTESQTDLPPSDDLSYVNTALFNYYKIPFAYRCNYENSLILREQFLYLMERSFYQEDDVLNGIYMMDYDHFAERLFLFCAEFNLTHECKYVSYGLFKRFICCHIIQLIKSLKESENDKDDITEYWNYINEKLKEQLTLRCLSCIQIASKLTDRSECVSNDAIHCYLNKISTPFTMDAIAKSELRVLSTVGYKLITNDNLFTYFELHMSILVPTLDLINADRLYSVALKILDIVQIRWTVILKSFSMCLEALYAEDLSTEQKRLELLKKYNHEYLPELDEDNFKKIIKKHTQKNYYIISCGVIAAAIYLMERECTEKAVQVLAAHIEMSIDVIALATTYIVMFVHNEG